MFLASCKNIFSNFDLPIFVRYVGVFFIHRSLSVLDFDAGQRFSIVVLNCKQHVICIGNKRIDCNNFFPPTNAVFKENPIVVNLPRAENVIPCKATAGVVMMICKSFVWMEIKSAKLTAVPKLFKFNSVSLSQYVGNYHHEYGEKCKLFHN